MSIDWEKAKQQPKKNQKIQNSYLLDIKAKTEDLEKRVVELRRTIEYEEGEIINTKIKLANAGSLLREFMEEIASKTEKIEDLVKEKEFKDNRLQEFEKEIEILKQKNEELKYLKFEVEEKEEDFIEQREKFEKVQKKYLNQKQKKSELENLIETKEEEIEQLKEESYQKDQIIRQLKDDMNSTKEKCSYMEERIAHIEGKSVSVKKAQDLLTKIQEIMELKGFLSEKELQLLKSGKEI